MPLPKPEPGLVVSYRYLWRHEYAAGQIEGAKDRPCVIIVAVSQIAGRIETVVAPVTHSKPSLRQAAVELPRRVKQHLGLDWEQSWVVVDDLNVFLWPGFDLHPISTREPGRFDYGFLPPRLFAAIRDRIVELGGPRVLATPRED